ncbi:MAG: C25 family cysteine peptidase [Bacteroidota bacterium]
MKTKLYLLLAILSVWLWYPASAHAVQSTDWYQAERTYLKIPVATDGVVLLTGADLAQAGLEIAQMRPDQLQLLERGSAIPFYFSEQASDRVLPTDTLIFFGERNTGVDDAWAYINPETDRSSPHLSLYSDTTYYWLTTQNAPAARRYQNVLPSTETPVNTHTVHRDTLWREFETFYYGGDSNLAQSPLYTRGEGYYWTNFWHSNTNAITRNFSNSLVGYAGQNDISVRVQLNGQTASRHHVQLLVQTDTGFERFSEADWTGYQFRTLTASSDSFLSNGSVLNIQVVSLNDFNGNPNRVLLDWIAFDYARSIDLNRNGTACFPGVQPGIHRLALAEPLQEETLVLSTATGEFSQVAAGVTEVPVALSGDGCVRFTPVSQAQTPPETRKVEPTEALASPNHAADYVIITRPMLRSSAAQLAQHRSQHYTTKIVYQDDIFDEFDGGHPTPLALRSFVEATREWRVSPRYFVIWGDTEHPIQKRPLHTWEVVTFGDTPADNWYVQQDEGGSLSEQAAIGRLPVRSNSQGALFLEKIRTYERSPADTWQKQMLLLAGSVDVSERNLLESYTRRWGSVAYDGSTAMDTLHFNNQSTRAGGLSDPSVQDSIRVALEKGTSWISYFGHSAAENWLLVLDEPQDFNNADRLPVVLSVGCHTGNFTRAQQENVPESLVYGEELVLRGLSGAIAHWGSGSLSTISQPAILTEHLHEAVFRDTVRVLGDAIRIAKNTWAASRGVGTFTRSIALQYGLIGDPATRLALPTQPDLTVTPAAIVTTPEQPLAADSLFNVRVSVSNLGLTTTDSTEVQFILSSPSGRQSELAGKIPPMRNRYTFEQAVQINDDFLGPNTLTVSIDPSNRLPEADETNNGAQVTVDVATQGIAILEPSVFELVPQEDLGLSVFVAAAGYDDLAVEFEMSTDASFSGADVLRAEVPATPETTWTPSLPPTSDVQLFHWRARPSRGGEATGPWNQSTVLVSQGTPPSTWHQNVQTFADAAAGLSVSGTAYRDSRWQASQYKLEAFIQSARENPTLQGRVIINNSIYFSRFEGYVLLVLDELSGERIYQIGAPAHRDSARTAGNLDRTINEQQGDWLIINSRIMQPPADPTIPDYFKAKMRQLGSTAVDTLTFNHLWVYVGQVGNPSTVREWVVPPGDDMPDFIEVVDSLFFNTPEGVIESPTVGPALGWQAARVDIDGLQADNTARVDVIDAETEAVLIADALFAEGQPISLASIDATRYPRLKLRATLTDSLRRNMLQLKSWSIDYTRPAELSFGSGALTLSADSLLEGNATTANVEVTNLGASALSRATVQYYLRDAGNRRALIHIDTLRNLTNNEVRTASHTFSTDQLVGQNVLEVRLVNEDGFDLVPFNNVQTRSFTVRADDTPPMFQVYLDDDTYPNDPEPVRNLQDPALPFLSARPTIEIELTDENPFKAIDDANLLSIDFNGEMLSPDLPTVTFEPSTGPERPARLVFTPDLSGRDTTHTLQVRAFDATGNEASGSPYQVHFRVQNQVEVESLYPYPNPMSAFTRFAFLLRGADATLVDDLRIRIFSLNGRLVREFDLVDDPSALEDGFLRIGWNKVLWDGRDEDGDMLGSGVYLYKVFMRAEGEPVLVNNDSGIEKVVLLR